MEWLDCESPGRRALACPTCRGALTGPAGRDFLFCRGCDAEWPIRDGYADFLPRGVGAQAGLGPRLMHARPLALIYDKIWRPSFIALASGGRSDFGAELERVEHRLAPARDGVIADLSCGPGLIGRHLATSGQFADVIGLDYSRAMVERCVEHCRRDGAHAFHLVRADVGHMPFADGALAGAHAGAAMHVWPDIDAALADVARVLRPGGIFVASTFISRDATKPRRTLERIFERALTVRVFPEEQMIAAFERAGLRDYRVESRGYFSWFSARRP